MVNRSLYLVKEALEATEEQVGGSGLARDWNRWNRPPCGDSIGERDEERGGGGGGGARRAVGADAGAGRSGRATSSIDVSTQQRSEHDDDERDASRLRPTVDVRSGVLVPSSAASPFSLS